MTSIDERITYDEKPSVAVAKFFRDREYRIVDTLGVQTSIAEHNFVGILKPQYREIKFLGFRWKYKQRGAHIGDLWFDNMRNGAIQDKKWVLEVYGRDYVKELETLVKDISVQYPAITVRVSLSEEQSRVERYASDLD